MRRMTGFPSREVVAMVKERYKAGTRVELVQMNDRYTRLVPGDKGTVAFVDDTATVFISWDNGSSLGAVYGEDTIRKI